MAEDDFASRMQRMERLIEETEQTLPPASLELVRGLVRAVLDVHESGLHEILDVARSEGPGPELVQRLVDRPSIGSLLLLHDLHPGERLADEDGSGPRGALDRPLVDATLIPASRLVSRGGGAA